MGFFDFFRPKPAQASEPVPPTPASPAPVPVTAPLPPDDGKISAHFSRADYWRSTTAKALGIDNRPTPEAWLNIERLAPTVQLLRDRIGQPLIISSGYRSPTLNAKVGGVFNSAHLDGLAVDLQCHGLSTSALCQQFLALCKERGIDFDQAIEERNSQGVSWLHIGMARNDMMGRRQTFMLKA